ncbi:MAG: hypothetical protein ACQEP1_01405 [Nanobdellota archaeon]
MKDFIIRYPEKELEQIIDELKEQDFIEPEPENRIEIHDTYLAKIRYIGEKDYENAKDILDKNKINYEQMNTYKKNDS